MIDERTVRIDWDTRALEWYRGTDTGISSETIFEAMTGIPVRSHSVPADAGDFGRCYRLLDKFPHWRQRIAEVAVMFPDWKPLVDNWETLESMYRKRDDEGMYQYINKLMAR
jgi:hypothetical protein